MTARADTGIGLMIDDDRHRGEHPPPQDEPRRPMRAALDGSGKVILPYYQRAMAGVFCPCVMGARRTLLLEFAIDDLRDPRLTPSG
jgi:hypothetical protein